MKEYKQIELPTGIEPLVKVFDKEFVNHPCQECAATGTLKTSFFLKKKFCPSCKGRGFLAYENKSMLFLGNPFKMADVLQVAKGMYAQMAKNPDKPDCGLCIKRPDQARDEEYRIRRGHVIEDLLALAKPIPERKIHDFQKHDGKDPFNAGY